MLGKNRHSGHSFGHNQAHEKKSNEATNYDEIIT